jgi:predicted nuclease of predicted toxin-antitoxin system
MRLLLDEHLSPDIAEGLRNDSHDVVTVLEAGWKSVDDEPLWRRAATDGRVLVSYNVVDFWPLSREFAEEEVDHLVSSSFTVEASRSTILERSSALFDASWRAAKI